MLSLTVPARRLGLLSAVLCVLAACAPAAAIPAPGTAISAGQTPPPCAPAGPQPPYPLRPTTVDVLHQAYLCILDHYVGGRTMDDRVLLAAAFAGLTQELERRGTDQPAAALPPLAGRRDQDWLAFSRVFRQVTAALGGSPALEQDLAEAAIQEMVRGLHDNHAQWLRQVPLPPALAQELRRQYPGGFGYGLGLDASSEPLSAQPDAHPPLYVTSIWPGGPADRQQLRAGDVIDAVNGVPAFAGGELVPAVMSWLFPAYPQRGAVRLTLRRPSTRRVWTVTVQPGFAAAPPVVSASALPGRVGYVRLAAFVPGAADMVRQAVARLARHSRLRGIVLDLRGNGGGLPSEVARLLGAFIHDRVWSYDIGPEGSQTANQVSNTEPLLHIRLAVLTDRRCASACDAFSDAITDLHIGPLIGTRTSGLVAGPAQPYLLSDNSILDLTTAHYLGANHEIINGIGVAPGYVAPLTAGALSAGRDPGIDKALTLLR